MRMNFKYKDKVVVTKPEYGYIAEVGTIGEIVDGGYVTQHGDERYLVRWESMPTILFGVHDCHIKKVDKDA